MKLSAILVFFLATLRLSAQQQYSELITGATVPDITFNQVYNHTSGSIRLSDYNGKYVILDFWNRYCTACIASFPKLQKLQSAYGDKLKIILVTENNMDDVKALQKTSAIVAATSLTMILSDSVLPRKLFPHRSEPFCVWLDTNGKVMSKTSGNQVNAATINKLLLENQLEVQPIIDIHDSKMVGELADMHSRILDIHGRRYSSDLKYFYAERGRADNYSLFLKSSQLLQVNLPWTSLIDSAGRAAGLRTIRPLYDLFLDAYSFPENKIRRIIFDPRINIPTEPGVEDMAEWEKWYNETGYCYEVVKENCDFSKAYVQLRLDLENYFHVTATVEQRPTNCYIFYQEPGREKLKRSTEQCFGEGEYVLENTESKNGIIARHCSFIQLFFAIQNKHHTRDNCEFIDETGIAPNLHFDFDLAAKSFRDMDGLKTSLHRYGIGIKTEIRLMPVLVIKKKSQQQGN